jgi:hypothetical protein
MRLLKVVVIAFAFYSLAACQQPQAKKENSSSSSCINIPQPTYAQISSSVRSSCGGSTCHDGSDLNRQNLMSELGLNNSATQSMTHLQNGTMPKPPKTMESCAKQNLLNYFSFRNIGGSSMPNGAPNPICTPITAPVYSQVSTIVASSCGISGCHTSDNSLRKNLATESDLRNNKSSSLLRLQNGSMPKSPGTISACDKQTLINYLQTAI